MKDSKKYSQKIKKLFSELKRQPGKIDKPDYDDPIEALIYATISEHLSLSAAKAAYKKLNSHFVDFNDLRISRPEEAVEVLGSTRPNINKIAQTLNDTLQAIFAKYDRPSLTELKEIGKRPAREILEKLEGISPFVIDYVVLTGLKGHAVPLTQKMIDYLKACDNVHPDAEEKDITGFLERQVSASNTYVFYVLLRQASESCKKNVKKTAKKKVFVKKTESKTTTKKKVKKKKK